MTIERRLFRNQLQAKHESTDVTVSQNRDCPEAAAAVSQKRNGPETRVPAVSQRPNRSIKSKRCFYDVILFARIGSCGII
jgi:hypothetical protein